MALSCDKVVFLSTKENSCFENCHLLPLKIPSFLFWNNLWLLCHREKNSADSHPNLFQRKLIYEATLHQGWNNNPHPSLTLSYWASVIRRVQISILAFRVCGTSSTIRIRTTSYASLNTNKKDNCVSSTSRHLFFPADVWNKTKALY